MSFTANAEIGEYKHKLKISEMPKHNHLPPVATIYGGNAGNYRSIFATNSPFWNKADNNNATTYSGADEPHNNIQPSYVVYLWKRIA